MADDGFLDWYALHNIEKPNIANDFNFVPDHITKDWPAPNFVDPVSRAWLTHIFESVTLVLACLAVGLRLFSRMSASKRLFPEDYAITASLLLAAVKTSVVLLSTRVGFGLHRWDIQPENFRTLNKYYIIGISFYLGSVMLTKASIILRYRRMFPPEVTVIRKFSHFIVFGFFALFVATLTLMLNTCHPVPSIWSIGSAGQCINVKVLYICNVSGNFAVDFAIYLLPLPYLWKLNLPTRQRVHLLTIFGLGFSVCCVALVELVVTIDLHKDGYFDWTWKGPILWGCTAFELLLALTAASLPDLKTLIAKFLPKFMSLSRGSSHQNDLEEARVVPPNDIDAVALKNPAALSPGFANSQRNSKRLSKPYWLRSQLDGSLFSLSTSRRGSAVPNVEDEAALGASTSKNIADARMNEKVAVISEERPTSTMVTDNTLVAPRSMSDNASELTIKPVGEGQ